MARILCNFDVGSLYPNLVRLYGYSSRSQKDKNAYVNLLDMRMKAKHGKLSEDVLKPMGLTNDDLKTGLKLPLNAYTGTLRASFNKNADFKQGFGICTTGQLLILQLVYDLQKIPTLEMVSTNTDAVMFTIEEEYKPQVLRVIKDWEDLTGLEMEEDKIVKIVMRDVNSYCEIVQVGDNDFKVNYKGGEFKGKHKFKWNKEERIFEYSFDDEIEANSLTIVSEALLKKLLFDIPIEDTINNCDDIFRFQMITHLGSTYEKCVQESPNGDIELQRNNRIYASNGTSGTIIKVKPDGRRDSLALCPPNPIVDNKNECTIEDVNKSWYIKIANQKLNDFLGIKRLTEYKKDELLTMAKDLGLEVDKKTKKDELIKMIEERNEVMKMATKKVETNEETKRGSQFIDISGNRYGHMIVLGLDHIDKFNKSYWKCRCDCGNEFVRSKSRIRISPINACGKCNYTKLEKRYTITHGDSPKEAKYHRLYNIWCSMKKRCYYPRHTYYNRYGGRGITICDEWLGTNGYATFKEWALSHGYKSNLTIERKDVDGNYCPENCCWIPLSEQSKNTSKVIKIPCYGRIYSLHEFCKTFHTSYFTVKKYIINGNMRPEDFLESRKIK